MTGHAPQSGQGEWHIVRHMHVGSLFVLNYQQAQRTLEPIALFARKGKSCFDKQSSSRLQPSSPEHLPYLSARKCHGGRPEITVGKKWKLRFSCVQHEKDTVFIRIQADSFFRNFFVSNSKVGLDSRILKNATFFIEKSVAELVPPRQYCSRQQPSQHLA